jgi:hypothetical protein
MALDEEVNILLRVHSTGIDIEVGVDLDRRDVKSCQYSINACQRAGLILRPIVLSKRPVEEAVTRNVSFIQSCLDMLYIQNGLSRVGTTQEYSSRSLIQ